MPGKTPQTSTRGKQDSKERLNSAQARESSAKRISIWPEWTEAELAAEKWDLGTGKGKEKGKNSQSAMLYEDAERVELPPSLVDGEVCWKRPADLYETPLIIEKPDCSEIDLVSANGHLMHSELMCWVISQLHALWQVRHNLSVVQEGEEKAEWRPWEHIHPHPKGALAPQINPLGKYCVRLYWMGAWRKVTVDDMLPFKEPGGEGDALLLPQSPNPAELWPAILTKAILKITALDSSRDKEFGDSSVVHMLTAWTPWIIPMRQGSGYMWELLMDTLPVWRRKEKEEGGEEEEEGEEKKGEKGEEKQTTVLPEKCGERNAIVLASFIAGGDDQTLHPSHAVEESTSELVLKEAGLIPQGHGLPSHPMLLTQARNQPLTPPPKEPPPPTLQAPYYLGLSHRQAVPGDPAPPLPSPPLEPQFVEIVPTFSDNNRGEGVWMEYAQFVKAFRCLHVFQSLSSFAHRETYCDLSRTVEDSAQTSATAAKKTASTSQLTSTKPATNNVLFVDSVGSVELQLVFCSLCRWQGITRLTPGPPSFCGEPSLPQSTAEQKEQVVPGSLVVEPYSWRSIQVSQPALRIATTGTTGATLTLPPGRHLFKLHARAPLGYHLEILSHSTFVLTDEQNVFSHMSKESCRFLAHCSHVVGVLLSTVQLWGRREEEELQGKILSLVDVHRSIGHARALLASTLHTWSTLDRKYGLTPAMLFAWKAFLHHIFAVLESKLPPADTPVLDLDSARRLLSGDRDDKTRVIPESWKNRDATAEEHQAAAVIQCCMRSHSHHRLQRVTVPGSSEHQEAVRELSESIALLQPHTETLGVAVFSGVFKLEPRLLEQFPFYKDECLRAFTKVYSGQYPPIQPHSWTIILREVFSVSEPLLMVPHFLSPLDSCRLRVVNNDTSSEVPTVSCSVTPHLYHPNKEGYTIVVEAWTHGERVEGGKWQLRLVGSTPVLPLRIEGEGEEVVTSFHTHEEREYCLPTREGHLFRFSLKVTQPCPISVQLSTSKRDAYFKLEILDWEQPVAQVQGKGHGVIPVHTLSPSQTTTTETREEENESVMTDVDSSKSHKYILQATVLRDSWPVADSAWPYISMIKSVEKLDEGRPGSEKPGSGKKGKGKGSGKKGTTPQPPTSQIDPNKPHWTLRIVTKATDKDGLEVRKDTERADELRSMVQAWEAEQPGRGKKAQESRQKFLESWALKDASAPPEEDHSTAVSVLSEGSSSFAPLPPTGPVPIREMDLLPFIIQNGKSPRVLGEEEQLVRQQERQKMFREYRSQRQAVLQLRNADRELRNETKLQQLEMAEQWQADLDELRNQLNRGREAIRERHQSKERARREAELAAQRAQEEQATAGRESKAKGKSGKGKK